MSYDDLAVVVTVATLTGFVFGIVTFIVRTADLLRRHVEDGDRAARALAYTCSLLLADRGIEDGPLKEFLTPDQVAHVERIFHQRKQELNK